MNAYVIVETRFSAGHGLTGRLQQDQTQVLDFPSRRAAYLFLTEHYTAEELEALHVNVMKRLPDGTLTLEF